MYFKNESSLFPLRPKMPSQGRMALFGLTLFLFFGVLAFWFRTPLSLESDHALRFPFPLVFVPNVGQAPPIVSFQAHYQGSALFFATDEIIFSLPAPSPRSAQSNLDPLTVRLQFEGANPSPSIEGQARLPGAVNYLIGSDPDQWRTNLPTYAKIIYRELYPGIDLHYTSPNDSPGRSFLLKGAYIVRPGADPSLIRWRYEDVRQVAIDPSQGDLIISLLPSAASFPYLVEQAPQAWQSIAGRRRPVAVHYRLTADGSVGLTLPQGYDPAYPLTIDPTLTYGSYVGGSSHDYGTDIAVDKAGYIYLTGYALSTDFPVEAAMQPEHAGSAQDAFIVKMEPNGTGLVYATYFGGGGNDRIFGVAVDDQGSVHLVGDTSSIDFPIRKAVQPDFGGAGPYEGDAFLAKLDPSGSALIYATYLGGKGDEIGYDLALDSAGNAHATGYTSSIDFPVHKAIQPDPAFPDGLNIFGDAFVTSVISASGVYTWGYSTYVGGTAWDEGHGIVLDQAGKIVLTGNTRSLDFPTRRPAQPTFGGGSGRGDAFATAIIETSGVYTFDYSTYLGGSDNDAGWAVALDAAGQTYLTGETNSADFPVVDPLQTYQGDQDVFVTKMISSSGVYTWAYGTYLGGEGTDFGSDIAVDSTGQAYLTGLSFSLNFPTTADALDHTCGTNPSCNGGGDAFFAQLNPNGNGLEYATYLGGGGTDLGEALALDQAGNIYLTGFTFSEDFPVSSTAYDPQCGAAVGECSSGLFTDAFVVKLSPGSAVEATLYLPLILKKFGSLPTAGCAPYLITTVGVGPEPRGLALDPVRSRLYVANHTGDSLSVLDTNHNSLMQTLTGLTGANWVAVDSARNVIWVTQLDDNQVTPIQADETGLNFTALPAVSTGDGPWGVVYDPVHDRIYVANSRQDTVTIIDPTTRQVVGTLTDGFDRPHHLAVNSLTGRVYVANYGGASVTVIDGAAVSQIVDLFDSSQPFGLAVDELRNLIYVATVNSHRIVVIGPEAGLPDQFLGWVALRRGFGDPARPVPLRMVAINPELGPFGDGGHLWLTTTTADGSEADQLLLISKGWTANFNLPAPYDTTLHPAAGIVVDRLHSRVYVANGRTPGRITVVGDSPTTCLVPFGVEVGFDLERFFGIE